MLTRKRRYKQNQIISSFTPDGLFLNRVTPIFIWEVAPLVCIGLANEFRLDGRRNGGSPFVGLSNLNRNTAEKRECNEINIADAVRC